MQKLDRYVLRNFFEPFLICLGGFIAIWLIIDFSDNSNDFLQARASAKTIAAFYLTQLPATILLSLPIGLLLAVLYSLSSMSRRNEIISMLTAGRSVTRVLLPLFGAFPTSMMLRKPSKTVHCSISVNFFSGSFRKLFSTSFLKSTTSTPRIGNFEPWQTWQRS